MDELFQAMSSEQVSDVQAHIVASPAVDIVGALSSMNVFEMDATDPTVTSFMAQFQDLDTDAQALVMDNANPLDQSGLELVTDAVTSIEALNGVIEGGSGNIAAAISDVRAKLEATPDGVIEGGSGFGLVVGEGEEASPVTTDMAVLSLIHI